MVSQQSFERFARYAVLRAGFAVACLLAVISNAGGASPPAKRTPNIVLILIDNLGKDWIGCYGSDENVTPHIDALAASGVRFQHAWVTAMCSTTRAAMLTGRYGFRTGWHTHHDTAIYGGGYFDWTWSVFADSPSGTSRTCHRLVAASICASFALCKSQTAAEVTTRI